MLIEFDKIVAKYGKPKGVVHVGAHLMEERNAYREHGLFNTIWVEANPYIFSATSHLIDKENNEKLFNFAISDFDGMTYELNVTNNGQSSSILELEKHKVHHPDIFVSKKIKIDSKRLDTLFNQENINVDDYNFLNLDIQGAELLALRGLGNLLDSFDFIYTEVNTAEIYSNCALLPEIDSYLDGFIRAETVITNYEWGDALYIKK
jgi:FkbM family methyltransferase